MNDACCLHRPGRGFPIKKTIAVISIEDLRRLEELEDALAAHEAVEAHQAGQTTPWEEVKEDLAEDSGDVPT